MKSGKLKQGRLAGVAFLGAWILLSAATRAEVVSLGLLAAADHVVVNGVQAPTGTTLFSGDFVEATQGPALVMLTNGSRLQLVKATARFSREGNRIVVEPQVGLIRFSLQDGGEEMQIVAGRYRLLMRRRDGQAVGSVALNANGQVAMAVCRGAFSTTPAEKTGALEVKPERSLVMLGQTGEGAIELSGDTLTDPSKKWREDELAGKLVRIGREEREILRNNETVLTVEGGWQAPTGLHPYEIKYPSLETLPGVTVPTGVLGMSECLYPPAANMIAPSAAAAAAVTSGAVLYHQSEKSATDRQ